MAMNIDRVYKRPQQAHLFDYTIQCIQDGLAGLSWLNHIFGRSERLVRQTVDGQRAYSPNVYLGNEEYIPLTPDNRELGNYCFFVMDEPQMVGEPMGVQNRIRSPFSLIVWCDMRTVEQGDKRDTEAIKEAVLKTIRRAWIKKGAVTLERVYERAENVFQGFSLDEIDNQFLMAPYWGMRVTGEIAVDEDCTENV